MAKKKIDLAAPPVHPWRLCPYGEHRLIEHPRKNPRSKSHPAGSISPVRWHCAHNPSGKDELYPDEIRLIASEHFLSLGSGLCTLSIEKGQPKFNDLIAGWVQYWNDILKPDVLLDPNVVKALIASESSFDPDVLNKPNDSNSARGLMQITNATRKLLSDKKELNDHHVVTTKKELNEPAINICAGIRWLFRKRDVASAVRFKRPATWIEAAEEYKGDLLGILHGDNKSQGDVNTFLGYLKEIEKCKR